VFYDIRFGPVLSSIIRIVPVVQLIHVDLAMARPKCGLEKAPLAGEAVNPRTHPAFPFVGSLYSVQPILLR
jgi:hypothetical protein